MRNPLVSLWCDDIQKSKHITLFLQVRHIGRVFVKLRVDLAKAGRHPYIQSWRGSLIQKSAILLDLWRDLLALDGKDPACRFARTLRRARHRLCDNLRAVSDEDMVHLTSQSPLSKCPASIWSEWWIERSTEFFGWKFADLMWRHGFWFYLLWSFCAGSARSRAAGKPCISGLFLILQEASQGPLMVALIAPSCALCLELLVHCIV